MNQEHQQRESGNGQSPDSNARDALLTAFALDQLTGNQHEAIKARLGNDPEARRTVQEIRAVAQLLRESTPADGEKTSDTVRKNLELRLRELEKWDNKVALPEDRVSKWRGRKLLLTASAVSAATLLGVSIYLLSANRTKSTSVALAPTSDARRTESQLSAAPELVPDDKAIQPKTAESMVDPEAERREKLAQMAQEFNRLLDEQRYGEAETIAQQAKQLDPNSEVLQNLTWKSRFVRRMREQHPSATPMLGQNPSPDMATPFETPPGNTMSGMMDPTTTGEAATLPMGTPGTPMGGMMGGMMSGMMSGMPGEATTSSGGVGGYRPTPYYSGGAGFPGLATAGRSAGMAMGSQATPPSMNMPGMTDAEMMGMGGAMMDMMGAPRGGMMMGGSAGLGGWGSADMSWGEDARHYPEAALYGYGRSTNEQDDDIYENKFVVVGPETALSTFSIDVDTASYANVRRFLTNNTLPPANAVRVEELVNYFQYDDPQPRGRHPFSINMEVAGCPWRTDHLLLRIGLKGKEIDTGERPPSNLVFLLDVSGSMRAENKLPLLKRAMKMLVAQLSENDQVTVVTYAGQAGLQLDTTSGDQQEKLESAINSLRAGGSTNGSAGIELAYQKAIQNYLEDGTNRVILATDGDLNVGISDDAQLVQLIKDKAQSGVFLTVLGFGTGNLKDAKLEKLADHGNGMYGYIDSLREARKVLVEQIVGSLVTIAKDVKIQVEFNPAEVRAYRLIGYENRVMAARDFHDDTKDAGEIGSGHSVTALYELEPTERRLAGTRPRPTAQRTHLRYQRTPEPDIERDQLTDVAKSGELLTLSLRYKEPDGIESAMIEVPLADQVSSFEGASSDFRFASSVAAFGMLLRGSLYCGDLRLRAVEEWATSALGDDPSGRRTEFVDLVRRAKKLRRR